MSQVGTERGWRIQLLSPNGWVDVSEKPMPKAVAKKAARFWKDWKNGSGRLGVRIVRVQVQTKTLAVEEL